MSKDISTIEHKDVIPISVRFINYQPPSKDSSPDGVVVIDNVYHTLPEDYSP